VDNGALCASQFFKPLKFLFSFKGQCVSSHVRASDVLLHMNTWTQTRYEMFLLKKQKLLNSLFLLKICVHGVEEAEAHRNLKPWTNEWGYKIMNDKKMSPEMI